MDCPVCKKSFDEYTGRRQKKFCSDACKIKFWNAKKKVENSNTPKIVIQDLTNNPPKTNIIINTTTKFKVYDYSSIPEGTPYNKKKALMAKAREEQDKQ